MQMELILKKLTLLEGIGTLSIEDVLSAVELEPNADKRAIILGALARRHKLPGLFDPVDGVYYDLYGRRERRPSSDVVRQLGAACLVPPSAQTSVFGWFGAGELKKEMEQSSFECNLADYLVRTINKLDQLIKVITPTPTKENKKFTKYKS